MTFLTSAKDDPAFNLKSDYVNVKYIGNEVIASSYLNFLKAKVLITTTPQLNIFTFKRKANIKHYCHIVHAPVDVHTYRKFAFDYFDSIFCSGEHQIKSIRHLEKARSLPKKKLLKTGLLYYDLVKESAEQIDKTTILIAPTWKEYSLLNKCGEQLIQKLLDCTRFNIILRPHPQSFKSFPDVINNITNKFNKNSRFILDKESTGDVSMKRSCLMISDLSGIIWDYIFIQSKPVLLFETPQDLRGFEDTEISHKSWEKELIHNHLETFNENYLDDLVDKVNRLLNNWSNEAFKVIKDESFYNFGKASDIAYKQLIEIVEKL